MDVGRLKEVQAVFELFRRAGLGFAWRMLPSKRSAGHRERIFAIERHHSLPIVHHTVQTLLEGIERFGEVLVGFRGRLPCPLRNIVSAVKGQQHGDEGHGIWQVVKWVVKVEFSTTGDLVGRLLQGHLDVGVVDTRTGQFQHGHDLVFVARVHPEEIRAHLRDGFGLRGFGFRKSKKLPEQRGFLTDAVPHRMNAFNHAGFPEEVFVSVPSFVPVVGVHLLVDQQRCKLIRRCVRRFVHHLLGRVKPRHVGWAGGAP